MKEKVSKVTSAYPLFLPRQDSRSIDDADALQNGVRHLGTHEPEKEVQKGMRDTGAQRGERESERKSVMNERLDQE